MNHTSSFGYCTFNISDSNKIGFHWSERYQRRDNAINQCAGLSKHHLLQDWKENSGSYQVLHTIHTHTRNKYCHQNNSSFTNSCLSIAWIYYNSFKISLWLNSLYKYKKIIFFRKKNHFILVLENKNSSFTNYCLPIYICRPWNRNHK